MRMAPNANFSFTSESTDPAKLDGTFHTVLVLVHGMGAAYRSEILLEWAEPLLQRMD
jgi:hypothetical protein